MSNAFGVTDVAELLSLMEQWSIAEVHLTSGDSSLDLVRASQPTSSVEPGLSAPSRTTVETMADAEVSAEPVPVIARAPVVGVFHLARRDFPLGAPQPGDTVYAGQVIGSIELMHVPSDLYAPIAGTIAGILAEDGAGVEYDQPLMLIRPDEEGRHAGADPVGAPAR